MYVKALCGTLRSFRVQTSLAYWGVSVLRNLTHHNLFRRRDHAYSVRFGLNRHLESAGAETFRNVSKVA